MLMSPYFKQLFSGQDSIEIKRAGIIGTVVIPAEHKTRLTYDANIGDNKDIIFSDGETVYVLADEFGIQSGEANELEANLFFVEGGVLIEIISGKVLLKGENDEPYSIDELGEIDYPRSNARINWSTVNDLRSAVETVTKHRFSTSPEATSRYVDNFIFGMRFSYTKTTDSYMFYRKVEDYYEDLGLGIFQFIDYSESNDLDEDDDHADISELEDVEDDEQEDEHDYKFGEEEDNDAF